MTMDATQVTGSPATMGGPRVGDVLAERYELLEVLDTEGPSIGYRALDQETERPVLVRILTAGLHTRICDEVVERLNALVGVGGRFLSSLLDADREGRSPFTVEAWPTGTQLSAILDARRSRGDGLGARELLPVVSRLAAALDALPRAWRHGDVRAERIWLDTDGLRLTGPYLLVALPPSELRERMQDLGPGQVAYPREVRDGLTSTSADRWGVASIAWEALTGRSPEPESFDAGRADLEPGVADALIELLTSDVASRPRDLTGLLGALADDAGLMVPQLDPEPHAPPTADVGIPPGGASVPRGPRAARPLGGDEEGTVQMPSEQLQRPRITGGASEGTQEVSLDQILEEHSTEGNLDPRLVRAALASAQDREVPPSGASAELSVAGPDDTAKHASLSSQELIEAPSRPKGPDSLDPRLVRAALGVTLDSDSIEALDSDMIEALDAPPPKATLPARSQPTLPKPTPRGKRPSAPKKPVKKVPGPRPKPMARPGSRPPSAKPRPAGAKARPAPKPRPAAPKLRALPESVPEPKAQAPAVRPSPTPPAPKEAAQPTVRPKPESAPQPIPLKAKPKTPPPRQEQAPQPTPATPAQRPPVKPGQAKPIQAKPGQPKPGQPKPIQAKPEQTQPAPRRPQVKAAKNTPTSGTRRSTVTPAPSRTGLYIVAAAIVVAVLIIGTAFIVRYRMRQTAIDEARARQNAERIHQISSQQ
ncbi:MAG: hypothetical protein AB8I08_28750 [Sandaracinaceae bacterium]